MSVIVKYPVMKLNVDGRHYFGEVKKDGHKYVPNGIGLFEIEESKFVMSEYVNKETMVGMSIVGNGNSGFVGYNENGQFFGPMFYFNDEGDISFKMVNSEGQMEKFAITIHNDGTYFISQFDRNGNFTNKVLSFKQGVFCFEYRLDEFKERTAVKERKVGWNYKYPFVRMHLLPYEHSRSVVPARVEEGTVYTYVGGAQTGINLYGDGIEEKYRTNYNYVSVINSRKEGYFSYDHPKYKERHNMFSDQSRFGYGINRYNDGVVYFGEVYDSKFGGIGCIRYNDYDYLGYVNHKFLSPDRTGMKVYKNGVIEFGSYVIFHDLRFEIHEDYLFIKSYNRNKQRGIYYKLYFDTFNVEEYSEEGTLLEKSNFPKITDEMKVDDGKPATLRSKLTGQDLLDNDMKDALGSYSYLVPKKHELDIIKFNNQNLVGVYVPDFVTKICKYCFNGKDNMRALYLPEKLTKLESYSLVGMNSLFILRFNEKSKIEKIPSYVCDCPGIHEVSFPKSVKHIAEEAFSKCKSLKKAYVYRHCVIEPGAFPKKCKIIILDPEDGKVVKKKKAEEAKKEIKKTDKPQKTKVKQNKVTPKPQKRNTSSIDFSDVIKSIGKGILFPFKLIFDLLYKLFSLIGKAFGSLDIRTNIFSIISIVIMAITVLMNFFKINVAVNEWATDNINVITEWFGFNLITLVTEINTSSLLINLLLIVIIILAFIVDVIINILVLVAFLLYLALFFVIGFAYALAIPIGMLILAIVGLVKDKSATNIAILILDICLIVLFYVAIYI